MIFPRNYWYVAAWDHEVRRQELLARTICNQPMVLWRGTDGAPHALEDRCCHRHMPLSEGRLIGDQLECPYHGLRYDPTGACVKIPSQAAVPPQAHVRVFPVVERYHWIWIWMGDPALADSASVTDFHWMDDPKWRAKGERLELKGNYLLIVENLLDLTHLQFVHRTTLGTGAISGAPITAERDGDTVMVTRWIKDSPPPPFYQKAGGMPADRNIDRWQVMTFTPPAFVRIEGGGAPAGTVGPDTGAAERDRGFAVRNLNAITPETDTTTHYFWAQAHNFGIDDPTVTELVYRQVHTAFLEDLGIISAQQRNLTAYGKALPPQLDLKQDAGAVQARRVIDAVIARENGAQAKAAE